MCKSDYPHGVSLFFNPRLASLLEIEQLFGISIKDASLYEVTSFLEHPQGLLDSSPIVYYPEDSIIKLSCTNYAPIELHAELKLWGGDFESNSVYVLALAWAKYIRQQFKTFIYCADINSKKEFFLLNEHGLVVSETLKKDVINQNHPIFGDYHLTKYAQCRYKGILSYEFIDLTEFGRISPKNTVNVHDFILHTHNPWHFNHYYFVTAPYHESLYKTKKPNNNPRLRYFCNMPHIQYFVEDSDWTYQLASNISIPTTTITYRADTIWRDTIILATIEDQYLKDEPMILTTATGEIIFILENNHFKIDKRWQSYFSTFPLQEEYKVDKNLDNLSYSFIDI